ncbi:hypothetical protein Bca4012_080023 [Brassica carinata]|uniref:Uncharacterized protein n=1 Tax=Brassica carinata TaxID=52824 RepID=A0A8X7P4S9_BRACI|nr:hypothetical protein Bca52824_093238 [Brassica carinata]
MERINKQNPQSIMFLLNSSSPLSLRLHFRDTLIASRNIRVAGITAKVREFADPRYKTFLILCGFIDEVRDLAPSTIERERERFHWWG